MISQEENSLVPDKTLSTAQYLETLEHEGELTSMASNDVLLSHRKKRLNNVQNDQS